MVNKKKNSRTSKHASRRRGLTAAAGTVNSSAPAHHDAASPRLDAAGGRVLLQENQGRRFEGLQKVLAPMALPKLNAERASLQWNSSYKSAADSTETRRIVMDYILREEIDWLEQQVLENSDNRHNQLIIQQVLGRRAC
jgi:hypothetical protein